VSRALIAIISVAAGLLAGVLLVTAFNGDDSGQGESGGNPTVDSAQQPASGGDSSAMLNGVNLTAYTPNGYSGPEVAEDLNRIKELGSTAVVLVPTWYMKRSDSNTIEPDAAKTPTDASLEQAISAAREAGLEVILKPHVDVLDNTFRGDIQPANRTAWFQSYNLFISIYADLAAGSDVGYFSVGTELKSLSGETDAWKSVIGNVRDRFGGQLTYAANWDEVFQVQFWDALDMIGVDAYFPLSQEGETPTPESLAAAWQPNIDGLKALSEQWERPVLLTEIGYPSQAGATAHPWEVREGDPPDQAAQAMAYQAAFDSFADQDWLRGILWWDWRTDAKPDEDLAIGYTPELKQAESVLSDSQGGG
jgi:hypothetical protein